MGQNPAGDEPWTAWERETIHWTNNLIVPENKKKTMKIQMKHFGDL